MIQVIQSDESPHKGGYGIMQNRKMDIQKLTGIAIFTAIVVILQAIGAAIRFGPFSVSLVLLPIVVGAALYGSAAGAWLGFVFSVVVLVSGDAAAFLAVNVPGTLITVLVKGTAAGLVAGLVYHGLVKVLHARSSKSLLPAVILSALSAPVTNTGLFLIGCVLFFLPTIRGWAESLGFPNAGNYMIFGMVGGNFLMEVLLNIVLVPVIVELIRVGRRTYSAKK